MQNKILLLLFLMLCLSINVLANGDEWVLSYQDKYGSYYVEKKSVSVNFYTNHMEVDFWYKTEPTTAGLDDIANSSTQQIDWLYNINHITSHITVNLNTSTYLKDTIIIYDKNNTVLAKDSAKDFGWKSFQPQSAVYNLVNTAMEIKLGKPHKEE